MGEWALDVASSWVSSFYKGFNIKRSHGRKKKKKFDMVTLGIYSFFNCLKDKLRQGCKQEVTQLITWFLPLSCWNKWNRRRCSDCFPLVGLKSEKMCNCRFCSQYFVILLDFAMTQKMCCVIASLSLSNTLTCLWGSRPSKHYGCFNCLSPPLSVHSPLSEPDMFAWLFVSEHRCCIVLCEGVTNKQTQPTHAFISEK